MNVERKTIKNIKLVLCLFFFVSSNYSFSQTVSVWMTMGDQSKLLESQPTIDFANGTSPNILFNESTTYQSVDGYGWTFTSGSADVISTLTVAKQDELLNDLFNTTTGLGINVIRIGIGATDMATVSFTYDDNGGTPDPTLANFNVSTTPDGIYLIPFLKKMLTINPNVKILATPWTAPKWMVDGENGWKGGTLNSGSYSTYAQYFVKYLQYMTSEGINVWAITPQNEPLHDGNDPSMYMSKEQQRTFIHDHLGPALAAASYGGVKIIGYDHNCDNTEYPIYVAASSYVDGSAFHLYGGDISAMTTVKNATNKNVYFTEQYTGATGAFDGDLYWHSKNVMIGSMRNWSKTALAWNLATDPTWRPRTPGGCVDCKGAYTITSSTNYTRNISYYTIGHFSKFVQPGAVRIETNTDSPTNLHNVAFKNPDGTITLVVVNDWQNPINFSVGNGTKRFSYTIPKSSTISFKWNPNANACLKPSLGADKSTCGETLPSSLNSNTTKPTNVSFIWYKNGTPIAGQTLANCTNCVDGPGTYVVKRDSLAGCSKGDTILITSSLASPNLGLDKIICNPSTYQLIPSNLGSFSPTTTWQWAVDNTGGTTYVPIVGATNSSLNNVRAPGNYRLTATSGSCSSVDNTVITSSLPVPVDACALSGPTTLNLSITNPGLNGTNYNWYDNAAGTGSPLAGGTATTSFVTPSISTTTTYYVKNANVVNGNVGPNTLFGSESQTGCTNNYRLEFTASSNFTLKAFKIPFQFFASSSGTITIEILDNTNTVRKTWTSDVYTNTGSSNGTTSLARFTFNNGNGLQVNIDTLGTSLKMRLSSSCTALNGAAFYNGSTASGYPFTSAGNIVTITGTEHLNPPSVTNKYAYFYDWEISTGNSCNPLPVIAEIGGSCSIPSPITLTNFDAYAKDNQVTVKWTTLSEFNNDYFIVQRSTDGVNFVTIGTVNSVGNSNSIIDYTFQDTFHQNSTLYYRIIQVDYSGESSTSPIVKINSTEGYSIQSNPNPFSSSTTLYVQNGEEKQSVDIEIKNTTGLTVGNIIGQTNEPITIGNLLPPGVYIIKTSLLGVVKFTKIIKY